MNRERERERENVLLFAEGPVERNVGSSLSFFFFCFWQLTKFLYGRFSFSVSHFRICILLLWGGILLGLAGTFRRVALAFFVLHRVLQTAYGWLSMVGLFVGVFSWTSP